MKRNVSVVRLKFRCNILIIGKFIKEMPGSVTSGTSFINFQFCIPINRTLYLREQGCEDSWLFFEAKKMVRKQRIMGEKIG